LAVKHSTLLVALLACLLLLPSALAGPGDVVVMDGTTPYVCNQEVHLDLLKVNFTQTQPGQNNQEAVVIEAGCSGSTFERVEIDVYSDGTGIRFQNPVAGAASDVTIGGGYVALRDENMNAAQYGVFVMGGTDIRLENLHVWGIDPSFTQALRIAKSGSGAGVPTNVICDGCILGGGANSKTVVIGESDSSGILNSYACPDDTNYYGEAITVLASAVNPINPGIGQLGENFEPADSDPHCKATDIRDSGLEAGSTFADGWTAEESGTLTAAWTYPDADARSGETAARVDVSSWTSGRAYFSTAAGYEIPVAGSTEYTASAWVKGTIPSFRWHASWKVSGTWIDANQTYAATPGSTYSQLTWPLSSPAGATELKLEPSFEGGNGYGLIDNVDVALRQLGQSCSEIEYASPGIDHLGTSSDSVPGEFTITYTLDQEYECGQFANGDWYVVIDPDTEVVRITDITPTMIRTANATDLRNGWIANPTTISNNTQWFDGRMSNGVVNAQPLDPQNPYDAPANTSVVKYASNTPLDDPCGAGEHARLRPVRRRPDGARRAASRP
jgi:hypothetical protein